MEVIVPRESASATCLGKDINIDDNAWDLSSQHIDSSRRESMNLLVGDKDVASDMGAIFVWANNRAFSKFGLDEKKKSDEEGLRTRKDVTEELLSVPWHLGGGFNAVLHLEEKLGGIVKGTTLGIFRGFVQDAKLIDLPLGSGSFTWSNIREQATMMLKNAKLEIKKWSGKGRSDFRSNIGLLENEIQLIENKFLLGSASSGEIEKLSSLRSSLWKML
ncbi:hypothetical protein V6N12_024241 [Hibiscus sabdariffa]|uniref:Uncharacterized protein n=1 Tax=Hibiscus sabdariffa TaxID=183260 RepID=A0ABR2G037_9ROSI